MLAEPVSSNAPRGGVPRNEAMTEYPSSTTFADSFTVTSDHDRAFPADESTIYQQVQYNKPANNRTCGIAAKCKSGNDQ